MTRRRYDFSITSKKYSLDSIPPIPGVYAVSDRAKKLVYVGQSLNIKSRISAHIRNANGQPALQQWFKSIVWCEICVYIFDIDDCERISGVTGKSALRCVEAIMITGCRPYLNIRRNLQSVGLKEGVGADVTRVMPPEISVRVGSDTERKLGYLDLQSAPGDALGLTVAQ